MPKRKIQGIMTKDVITAEPKDTIKDVIKKLSDNGISGLPVINKDNEVVGMVSETDILQALKTESRTLSLVFPSSHALGMTFEETKNHRALKEAMKEVQNIKIEKIMKTDVISVNPENTIAEVSSIMTKHNINRVPVVKKDKLIGIVTRGDIIKGLSKVK